MGKQLVNGSFSWKTTCKWRSWWEIHPTKWRFFVGKTEKTSNRITEWSDFPAGQV